MCTYLMNGQTFHVVINFHCNREHRNIFKYLLVPFSHEACNLLTSIVNYDCTAQTNIFFLLKSLFFVCRCENINILLIKGTIGYRYSSMEMQIKPLYTRYLNSPVLIRKHVASMLRSNNWLYCIPILKIYRTNVAITGSNYALNL